MDFAPLERAILHRLCDHWAGAYPALPAQIAALTCTGRVNTGNGFFTDLRVDRDGIAPLRGPYPINGHSVMVEGLDHSIGLMLFFENGYLTLLEGYSIGGDDTSGVDFTTARFGPVTPDQAG